MSDPNDQEAPPWKPVSQSVADTIQQWQQRKSFELDQAVARSIELGVGVIRIFRNATLGDDLVLRYVPDVLIITDFVEHRQLWQGPESAVANWLEKEVLA